MTMRAIEFEAHLDERDSVTLPPEVAGDVPRGRPLRVILLIPDQEDDTAWSRLGLQQFAAGYDESDAIYDDITRFPAR